jgi:Spy/CpxP family protein refolding chaperone
MSDPRTEPHNSDRPHPQPHSLPPIPRTKRSRTLFFATLVVAAGLTGAAVTKAVSNPFGFGPGFHGMRGPWSGPLDPAQIEDRADRMVRHLSVELDATTDQQEKLRTIMRGLVKDVVPVRERTQNARRQARELLTQTTIDRGALEKLRAEQIALADTVSKRVVQAVADAAEVLSPEQRRKLNDRIPPVGSFGPPMGRFWHRG